MGFYCIGFSIKLAKNQACNEDQCSFVTSSRVKEPMKRSCEKHILEAKESSARLHFVRQAISQGTYETLCLEDFLV